MGRNFDAAKLDYLQAGLSKIKPLIPTIREIEIPIEAIGTGRYRYRIPDLYVPTTGIVIEHDTEKVHGELSAPNKKTLNRNQDYIKINQPFIIINSDLAKLCNLDEANLLVYLYYHRLMDIKSKEELK